MTKTIDTLVEDIYELLDKGITREDTNGHWEYGNEQRNLLVSRLDSNTISREPKLRLSSIGTPCARKLWYGLHHPDEREPFLPGTKLKFLYGDVIEELVLQLARTAGHLVEGEQDQIEVNGVKGHRDCVIDGVLVDVKSASPYSFTKFQGGLQREDDSFGYLTQLGSYLLGGRDDPLVKEKNKAAFLVLNKVTGKLHLDMHEFTEEDFDKIRTTISERKEVLSRDEQAPEKGFDSVPEGKSGNKRLSVNCSYCDFKKHCWPELRTFLYGRGPVFLTHVEREPNVTEVTNE
jgi:hypothetical protein